MKVSKSKAMREWLVKGLRKAKKTRTPSDGRMFNLFYETLANGWHYQVEYIFDTRRCAKPYVAVYGFKPPKDFSARSADVVLTQELG